MTIAESHFFEAATRFFRKAASPKTQRAVKCIRNDADEMSNKMFADGWRYVDSIDTADPQWIVLIFEKQGGI